MTSSLYSLSRQHSNASNERLLVVLKDIVNHVQIQSNFCIFHPNYPPFQLPDEAVVRFQSLPQDFQQKYLHLHLSGFLYNTYYVASRRTDVALDGQAKQLALDLENDSFLGVDLEFYQQVHQSNSGIGYFGKGWQILREEEDGSLAVTKGGFRLHIHRERHFQSIQQSAGVGDLVAVQMPKNMVQEGFYIAMSNVEPEGHDFEVTVYFNLSPEGAIAVMRSLTQRLNAIPIFFNFKVLYNPRDYGRYDAGFLYFEQKTMKLSDKFLKSFM